MVGLVFLLLPASLLLRHFNAASVQADGARADGATIRLIKVESEKVSQPEIALLARLAGHSSRIVALRESKGGFVAGEIFAGTDVAGTIVRVSAEGRRAVTSWATLAGETGLVRGLHADVLSGELIAVTTQGGVWRVDAAGNARRIVVMITGHAGDGTESPVGFEDVMLAPNEPGRYGPWAGKILAVARDRGAVYAIDANGAVERFDLDIPRANNIRVIPAGENFFGVTSESSGQSSLYGAPASDFTEMTGDLLITQAGGEACGCLPALWRVHWDGAEFQKTKLAELDDREAEWGQIAFSLYGAELLQQQGPVPLVGPTGRPAAVGADDLMLQEAFIQAAGGVTTVAANGNDNRALRFINTLFNNGDAPGVFVVSAPTIPAGFTVTASGDSGATFASLNNGGTVRTNTPVNPRSEERNIDIKVTVPAGTAVGRDYDLVIQVTSATDASKFDRTTDRLRISAGPTTPPAQSPLRLTKTVRDLNGGLVLAGDTLEYSLTLTNVSTAPIGGTFIAEFIPPNVAYFFDSVRITAGPNQGAKTDRRGDDEVEYFPESATNPSRQINIFTGMGARAGQGGTLAPNESTTAVFQVGVDAGLANGFAITNGANCGANGQYPVPGCTSIASSTVSAPAPLVGPFSRPDAMGPSSNNDDFTLRRANLGSSNNLTTRPGQLQFINTLRNNGDVPGRFVISAPTIPQGFTVLASADSGATFVPLNQGTVTTPTEVQPFRTNPADSERNLDVRIVVPAGLTINTDYDVGILVCREDNLAVCNRTIDRVRPDPAPPNLSLVKAVRSLSGVDLNGQTVARGTTVEYTLTLTNQSMSPAANATIAEYLPANVTYVAGSSRIVTGANAGAKTDARGDDQADYFPTAPPNPNGQINFFVGTGAAAFRGGTLAPNESTTVAFRVTVNASAPLDMRINNGGTWGAEDFGIGGESNIVTFIVGGVQPNAAIPLLGPFERPDAVGPTDNNDDFTLLKVSLTTANNQTTIPGNLRFINTLRNAGAVAGRFIISAPTIPPGFTVRVSVDSGATFVSLNQGGTATTPTEVNANEARNLDVQVDLPPGLTVGTDYNLVLQAQSAADATQTNRTIDRVRPDLNPPSLALTKGVRDLNGADLAGKTVAPGQTIEYTLTLRNTGTSPVGGTFIAEYLPPNVAYVASSTQIAAGMNQGAKTDRRGDDQVDVYLTAYVNGQINIFTGAGAASDRGGTLAPNESTTVAFRVTVNANAARGTVIRNGADWGAADFGIGGKSNIVEVTVEAQPCVPPAITVQPADRQICGGTSAIFNVTATGSNLTYQWRKDSVNIPGATSSQFVIVQTGQADVAKYDVVVSNACGTVTSNAAQLTIVPPPTITTQPVSQTRFAGQSVTFSVTAPGSGLTYQWRKNGVNIAGATSSSFTIAAVAAGDAGNYDVVVTGGCGSVTSAFATLTVNQCPVITVNPATAALPAASTGVAYSQTFTAAGGVAPVAFSVIGTLPAGLSLNAATGVLSGTPTGMGNFSFTIRATDANGCTGSRDYMLSVIQCVAPAITVQPADRTVCGGTSAFFNVTATGTNLTYQWRKDGVNIPGATSSQFVIVQVGQADVAKYDVVVSNACGTATSSAAQLNIVPPPTIITQPVSQTRFVGQSVTFSVTAPGGGLTYQWRKNGVNIAGATSSSYTIAAVAASDAGNYDVVVTGGCGSVTSAIAVLTVNQCPVITVNPATAALPAASTGVAYSQTFTSVGGAAPITFSVVGTLPAGLSLNATTGVLSGTPTGMGSFSFTIRATDANGCTGSRDYMLSVIQCVAPAITVQPADRTICGGTSAFFNVTATGTNLSYQWRKNGVNIPGATSSQFVIVQVGQSDVAGYDVVVSNACGTATSNAAQLAIVPPPTITTQPVSQTRFEGNSVTFTVAATGGLTFQWRKNGVNIPGATGSSYTIAAVTMSDAGNYDVIVTGGCDSVTSAFAVLTVTQCPVITITPAAGALPSGVIGTAYSQTFTTSGGVAPVTLSLAGTLPGGLSFNAATGVLSGTPAATGAFAFTVTARDANGCTRVQNYTLAVGLVPSTGDACRLTFCFRSANYFSLNWGTNNIPNGAVLIDGVNFGTPVTSTDPRVKLALDGNFGALNREYVATQLNILGAGGMGAANIQTALLSELRCYGLDFDPVTVSGALPFTRETRLFDLIQFINAAVKQGISGRDACVLARILNGLNGDSKNNVCHRATAKLDFSSCN